MRGTSDETALLLALGLFVAVCGLFWPALGYDFAPLDDDVNIVFNPHQAPLGLASAAWAFGRWDYTRRYAPLGWTAFSAIGGFSQLSPWGYHGTNILLHAANTVLLFLLLRRLLGDRLSDRARERPIIGLLACFFAAAWWAVHPLRVEHVAWNSAVPTNLAYALLLGALLAHAAGTARWRGVAALLYAGSLLSYPVALGAAFFFPLLDSWRGERSWLRRSLPYFALAFLSGCMNLYARASVTDEQAAMVTLVQLPVGAQFSRALCVWAQYLWRPFLPLNLAPVYRELLVTPLAWGRVAASAALLAGLTMLAWRKWDWRLFAIGYAAVVLPVTGFTELIHFAHDRYAVLPGLLMALAAALCLARLRLPAVVAAGLALTCLLAVLSWRQLPVWRDGASLTALIRGQLQPGDATAIRDVRPALRLFREGDYAGADGLIQGELQQHPADPGLLEARRQLATLWESHRSYIESLGLSVSAVPPAAVLHHNLALSCLRAGEREAAAWHLAEMNKLAPAYYERLAAASKAQSR